MDPYILRVSEKSKTTAQWYLIRLDKVALMRVHLTGRTRYHEEKDDLRFFVDKAHEQEIDAAELFFSKLAADTRTISH
ncbi:MAG TPA: hypothetical protein VFR94_02580 [Nitrososphaeraceae archaeon]|nr:hypothetical protein [Nitrososphaeraceae archaeon]